MLLLFNSELQFLKLLKQFVHIWQLSTHFKIKKALIVIQDCIPSLIGKLELTCLNPFTLFNIQFLWLIHIIKMPQKTSFFFGHVSIN